MQRHLFTFIIAISGAALALAACDAHTDEGCVSGPCASSGTGGAGGASSGHSSASGTGGGDAGLNSCEGMDPPATGDFPCDVFDVIHRECNGCHTNPPKGGAPFPILTFEDVLQPYGDKKVYQVMNTQIRPGASPRMPLGGMLNDQDLKVLGDWLDSCAPPKPEGMGCECPGMGCTP